MEQDVASFLGRGWSFPVRFTTSLSRVEMVEMEVDVRESLILLLSTYPGERVTNPEFGTRVRDFIYSDMSKGTMVMLREEIYRAIKVYEARIELNEVILNTDVSEGIIFVHLDYTIRRVNMRTNIVFPYYKIEGTEIVEI
jgi:uncharacterized protein